MITAPPPQILLNRKWDGDRDGDGDGERINKYRKGEIFNIFGRQDLGN
jgi:hypothetical protein